MTRMVSINMYDIKNIPIDRIRPNPFQPRETFDKDKIIELANSIKEFGLIQPIIVRKTGETYQIIAGERRWRAFQFVEIKEIPCIILDVDDTTTMELSLVENWHRLNLDYKESEKFIVALYEKGVQSGHYKSLEDMAKKTSIPRSTISTIISAHQDRKELGIEEQELTYQDIYRTKPLENDPTLRKSVLSLREKGKISATDLRDFSITLKKASPPVKEALLRNSISTEEAKIIDTELTTARERERVVKYLESERSSDRVAFHVDFIKKVEERKEFEAEFIETATGDIWICPICNKKYRLIHIEPTGRHKFEEAV